VGVGCVRQLQIVYVYLASVDLLLLLLRGLNTRYVIHSK